MVAVAVIISRISGLLVLVGESGLQEDMDKWSKERDERRKRFQDKQKEEELSTLHRNPVCCSIHTLVFSCMVTFTCLLSCILLSSKVFISKFSFFLLSVFFLFSCFGFSLSGMFPFLQSSFFLGSLVELARSWLSFPVTASLVTELSLMVSV